MSRRTSIITSLATKLQGIDGTEGLYNLNLFGNAYGYLKFWDEVNDFPSVYTVAGVETREYHPSNFTWRYFNVSLKLYTKGENSAEQLEQLLEDVETVIDANRVLVYNADGDETTEILVMSITTDEGLLLPYSIGEVNLQIRYTLT